MTYTDMKWNTIGVVSYYDYFNVCAADIAADHFFDVELYPKCAPNKINYFYKNGLIAANEDEAKRIIKNTQTKVSFRLNSCFP